MKPIHGGYPDAALAAPIDMVLHCPECGMQHIDATETHQPEGIGYALEWTNPPHRSHLCAGCGFIWRPADVPTNGVAAVKTKGQRDGAAPAVPKITVTRDALYRVLLALDGQPHHIRELQATRSLHALGHPNPIQILIDEFNADSKKKGMQS